MHAHKNVRNVNINRWCKNKFVSTYKEIRNVKKVPFFTAYIGGQSHFVSHLSELSVACWSR